MRIGIDIMGGDFAPEAAVSGVLMASKVIPSNTELVLFGEKKSVQVEFSDKSANLNDFNFVDCPEQIAMSDHPYKSFFSKKNSSIYIGFQQLKSGKIDAFCSAGNTGSMMIGSSQVINSIPGIIRPAIAAQVPSLNEISSVILDVGLNPDSRPDVLFQYGILGAAYFKSLHPDEASKVGLINIGSEPEKGNLTVKSAFQLMVENNAYDFVGNIETNNLMNHPGANVFVCDGFVGNVIIKEAEGFYRILKSKNIKDDFFEFLNFENFGGTPILGINKPVVVGHGISNTVAIKNMILHTIEVTNNNLISNIKEGI